MSALIQVALSQLAPSGTAGFPSSSSSSLTWGTTSLANLIILALTLWLKAATNVASPAVGGANSTASTSRPACPFCSSQVAAIIDRIVPTPPPSEWPVKTSEVRLAAKSSRILPMPMDREPSGEGVPSHSALETVVKPTCVLPGKGTRDWPAVVLKVKSTSHSP